MICDSSDKASNIFEGEDCADQIAINLYLRKHFWDIESQRIDEIKSLLFHTELYFTIITFQNELTGTAFNICFTMIHVQDHNGDQVKQADFEVMHVITFKQHRK